MSVLHPLPVILPAAQIVIAAGAPQGYYTAQPGIRNTESVGVLIDKIVFSGATPGGGGVVLAPTSFAIELKWRNEQVTAGVVALAAVSWPRNRGWEAFAASAVIELAKPMYLEPGDNISVAATPQFIGAGGRVNGAVIQAVAIGRQALAPPAERWLPYLCDYLGPVYAINGGAVISDQSTPADLGNPFDTPLFIERMIGRILVQQAPTAFSDQDVDPVWFTYNMRVSDHRDNFWVAQPTPLPLVCNAVDRSWILNHVLEPKGFLRVEFEGTANVADAPLTSSQAVVGLVGFRRIET